MKYRIFILTIFLSHSILLTAQRKNSLCKTTLPLSAETVSIILTAMEDKSIRSEGYLTDPTICLEGQMEAGFTIDLPDWIGVAYIFLTTKSKNKVLEKYNELLKEFKKCRPENWYVTETDFNQKETLTYEGDELNITGNAPKQYLFTDKENYYRKAVRLWIDYQSSNGIYALSLFFDVHFPGRKKYVASPTPDFFKDSIPCSKFSEIFSALKDGSIRVDSVEPYKWKTTKGFGMEVSSECRCSDLGKPEGSIQANYVFIKYNQTDFETSLEAYHTFKKYLLTCYRPDGTVHEQEPSEKDDRYLTIISLDKRTSITLTLSPGPLLYVNFNYYWLK